jgi:molecular chaperone DnaK
VNVLSVDLGTANTVAVLAEDDQPPRLVEVMPSCVFADEQDGQLLVGRDAEARARRDPSRFEPQPKRRIDEGTLLLGDSIISVTHLLGAVLHRIVGEAVRQLDGRAPDELRLTHPDRWDAARCNVLLSAARLAGLPGEPILIPESRAAATHFTSATGQHLRPGQAIAVYDFGAGSFTCTVLGATEQGIVVLAEDGLTDLGGLAVDQALLEYLGRAVSHRDPSHWQRLLRPESVEDRIAQRELREQVRIAKEKLTTQRLATVPMPKPFDDADVNRTELDALIRPSLLRSVELLESTISAAGLIPDNLLGAYLIGGASRMPLVGKIIGDHLDLQDLQPISIDQPELAIAFGALEAAQDTTATPADFHPDPVPEVPTRPAMQPVAPPRFVARPRQTGRSPQGGPPQHPGPPGGGYPNFPPSRGFQPPSGGFPATRNYPPSGPVPPRGPIPNGQPSANPGYPRQNPPSYQQQQPYRAPAETPTSSKSRKPLLIGIAAAIVVALAVVGGIIFFSNGSAPAASCRSGNTTDARGFTPCLRQLAGAVPQHAQCVTGTGGVDIGVPTQSSTLVTCQLGGTGSHRVVYQQGGRNTSAASIMEILLPPDPRSLVQADWTGNSLSGHYETSVVGRTGVLVFSVQNSSVLGILTANQANLTPDQLADYFQRNVQPGT